MKAVTLKLPENISQRTAAIKERTGISEASILRQCIQAGLATVEKSMDLIHSDSPAEESAA